MNNFAANDKVEEIRRASDILDIISEYVSLTKSGRNYKGLCPFHHEKTPSFMVSPDKQIYHCFGCGAGGNVFAFLMKHENLTFPAVLKKLAAKYGIKFNVSGNSKEAEQIDTVYKINEEASVFFSAALSKTVGKKARSYLDERGIDELIIKKFNVGYAPDSWDSLSTYLSQKRFSREDIVKSGLVVEKQDGRGYYDRFRDRVIFPIEDRDGKVVGFGGRTIGTAKDGAKYINSPETPIYRKGKILYGLSYSKEHIREAKTVLITEGYMDAITAVKYGFNNIVATLGTALTEDHLKVLRAYTDNLILVFDADAAGVKAVIRAWETIAAAGLSSKVLVLPSGEDLDSSLRNRGSEFVQKQISDAVDTGEFIISELVKPFDLKDSGERKKALDSIFEALSAVSGVYNIAIYGSFIAEILKTDERIIIEAFKSVNRSKRLGDVKKDNELPERSKNVNSLDAHLLMISLASKEWALRVFEAIDTADIEDRLLSSIAEKLKVSIQDKDNIDIGSICQELDETSAGILSEIAFRKEEVIDIKKSFDDCINMFRRRQYIRALEMNKAEIKKALSNGNEGVVEHLLKENQRLQFNIKAKF
ncbi:MAG: DNA primase [Candidatus Schekmanbacteria bacterium]|nr:DNA primase [Candidatus Schekmanbacteria bacterium]